MSKEHEDSLLIARCLADANKRLRAIEDAMKKGLATHLDVHRMEVRMVELARDLGKLGSRLESEDATRHAFAKRAADLREEFSAKMAELGRAIDAKTFEAAKSFNPRGEWEIGMTLNRFDVVTVGGSSYLVLKDGVTEKPNSRSKTLFQLIARRGGGGGGGGALDSLKIENNLSDVANAATARANLGLGNVDDTSDAAKPISTLTQAALDLKANASGSNVSANAQAWRTAISAGLSGHGAFQNLRGILRRGRSASALIAADSTSNAQSEWFYLFLQSIAAANPTLNVVHQEWDMTAQSYLAPTYVQTGSNGAGYIEFTSPPPATTTPPSLPATAAITGDFGGAVQITAADYTPAALQLILRLGNAGDNNVWWLALNTTGTLRVTYNTNAGASGDDQTATSTVALSGVTDGVTKIWVGFTYDRDNGSGGSDFKFYTSTDGLIWTQLGATVTKTTNNLIRTNGAANSWWLGGTAASFPFVGKIHAVRVLAGSPSLTTGVYQIPEEIAAWNIGNESYQAMGGGQTLWAYNASLSGQTLDYHTATAARTASICIHNRIPFVIFSSAHNYGTTAGATYRGYLDTARAAVATALPNATFAGSTQNPQISPRSLANQLAQEQRARDMVQWCRENGIGCVNGYEAFVGSGLDLSTLIDGSDGVHPNNAGSLLWRDAAFAEWNAS
jgi:hypothetical protein